MFSKARSCVPLRNIVLLLVVSVCASSAGPVAAAQDTPCDVLILQPGPDDGKDAWIQQNDPATNHGNHPRLALRGPQSVSDAKNLFMEFPIPSDAKKVELVLHQYDMDRSTAVEVREVIDPWDEGTITWNNRPSVQATPFATFAVQPGTPLYTVDLTAGATPGQSLSIEMRILQRWGSFHSSDAANPSLRPKLLITRHPLEIAPAKDAWIQRNAPDANYGSHPQLALRGPAGVFDEKRSMLEFDVPQDAVKATLVLSQHNMNRPTTVKVYRITGSWDEGTVTWNNSPSVDPSPFATFAVQPGGSQLSVDVTPAMIPGQRLGIELEIAAGWGAFHANDYSVNPAFRPRLEVNRLPARVIRPDPQEGKDAWVQRNDPNTNHATHPRVALRGPNPVFDEKRILMEFAIPSDAFTVNLVLSQYDMHQATRLDAHRILDAWDEATVTWSSRPPVRSTPFSSSAVNAGTGECAIDLTPAAVPGKSLGLELRIADAWGSFYSSDYAVDPSLRPALVVSYLPVRTVQPDPQNGKDAWVQRNASSANYGNHERLALRGPDRVFDEKRALLEFDVPADAVTVHLVLSQYDMDRATVVNVHEVTGSWNESSVAWSNRPSVDPLPSASFAVDPGSSQYRVDLTTVAVPGQPLSLELRIADRWGSFYSSDYTADPSLRPKLEVTHFCGRTVAVPFVRGDVNASNAVDLSDAVFALKYLFTGGSEPSCMKSADVNDSGAVDLSDSVFLLGYLFLGEAPPPLPFPACGLDRSPDTLSCDNRCAN